MTEQDVQDWLDEYGRAWVDGDPDRVVVLFSGTATYRETPFDKPMRGRREISEQGALQCMLLEEWWHSRKS